MKAFMLLGLMLLWQGTMPTSAQGPDNDDNDDDPKQLLDKLRETLEDMRANSHDGATQTYLEDMQKLLDTQLPNDPQLRDAILKELYSDLGLSQGQAKGRRDGNDPFDPFREVPLPR